MTRVDMLTVAVRTAIAHRCDRKAINIPAWASTYGVSQKLVRECWEAELTKSTNANDGGEGK